MHPMTKINKITSAAKQNQPVHKMTETSSFMSLLSLGSSLIIFSSFLFFRSLVKNDTILIEINNGQPIPLMWYIFILLFFRI